MPSSLKFFGMMAGTTGLEPATSAVTGQRSNQLSYVPRLFFNNLVIRHIESSGSQLSLLSLFSTISPLWTQFWVSVDTMWTPGDPMGSNRRASSQVYRFRAANGGTNLLKSATWGFIVSNHRMSANANQPNGLNPWAEGDGTDEGVRPVRGGVGERLRRGVVARCRTCLLQIMAERRGGGEA